MLYKPRNEAIKFCDNYPSTISDAKNKAKNQTTKVKGLENVNS